MLPFRPSFFSSKMRGSLALAQHLFVSSGLSLYFRSQHIASRQGKAVEFSASLFLSLSARLCAVWLGIDPRPFPHEGMERRESTLIIREIREWSRQQVMCVLHANYEASFQKAPKLSSRLLPFSIKRCHFTIQLLCIAYNAAIATSITSYTSPDFNWIIDRCTLPATASFSILHHVWCLRHDRLASFGRC